jgi:hypothetical protein
MNLVLSGVKEGIEIIGCFVLCLLVSILSIPGLAIAGIILHFRRKT